MDGSRFFCLYDFYFYPQQNSTMSWAVKIRKNILNG